MVLFFSHIGELLRLIWAILCVPIYAIIRNHFNIFIKIAELDIASNVNINEIYNRVTMIITIVMTFYVTFSVVKYTVSPETINDKEKGAGKVVIRIMGAILLIAFVPTIFSTAYELQNRLIKTQVFSKIILGKQAWDYSSYGSSFSADTFGAFYRVDEKNCENDCESAQKHVNIAVEKIKQGGSTISIVKSIVEGENFDDAIEFDGLLAVIFGCFVIYVLFLYSIDVAIRVIQLLYLQIIAPIAIMSFIIPNKDNMFQKWTKQCITTYLDLFIRISIMYFGMLLIDILGHSWSIVGLTSDGKQIGPIAYIFFIVGILIFIQRAPKLLSELLPQSGAASIGFGTSWKTRGEPLKKSLDSIKKPIATTVGGVSSAISTINSIKNGRLKEALKEKYTDENGKDMKGKRRTEQAFIVGKSLFAGGREAAKNNRVIGAYANRANQANKAANKLFEGGSSLEHDVYGLKYQHVKERLDYYMEGLKTVVDRRKTAKDSRSELKTMKAVEAYVAEWNERGMGDPTKRGEFRKTIEKMMDTYATSGKTAEDKEQFEVKLKNAIQNTGIYERDSEAERNVITFIKEQFIKDAGTGNDRGTTELEILERNIKEYLGAAKSIKSKDGSGQPHIYTFQDKDENGHLVTKTLDASKLTLEQLVKYGGDIETAANSQIVETRASNEYKTASANAHIPGQNDGNSSNNN